MKKYALISLCLSLCLLSGLAMSAQSTGQDYYQKHILQIATPAFNSSVIKSQIEQLNKTQDYAKKSYNNVLEAYALDKLGLIKGKGSKEYLLAFIRFKLNQGGASRKEATKAIDKVCTLDKGSYECVQAKALLDITSSQKRLKLQPFYMHETNRDYKAAVLDIQKVFEGGVPVEHDLRYRYYMMLGNIEGYENEAIIGLDKIYSEIPYDTTLKIQILKDIGTFKAQKLANLALTKIDDPKQSIKAQNNLEKAIKTDPQNKNASYWAEILQISKYYRTVEKADEYLQNQKLKEALDTYHKACKIDNKSPYAYVGMARVYTLQKDEQNFEKYAKLSIKHSLKESKDEQTRIATLMQALRASIYVQKAEAAYALGNKVEAIALYQKALKLDKQNPWLYYDLASIYLETKQEDKANALFLPLKGQIQTDSEYAFAYSLILSKQGHNQEAFDTLKKFRGVNESIDSTLQRYQNSINYQLAQDLYARGDLIGAIEVMQQVNEPYARATLAQYYYENNQKKLALNTLQRAINEDPGLDYAKLRAAQIAFELGDSKLSRQLADGLSQHTQILSLENIRELALLYSDMGNPGIASNVYLSALTHEQVKNNNPSDKKEILKQANEVNLLQAQDLIENDPNDNQTKAWIITNLASIQKIYGSSDKNLSDSYRLALSVYNGEKTKYQDDGEYTYALLTSDDKEHWLLEHIKANGSEYYQRNNIIVTDGISFLRDSGHSGYSDYKGYINMTNISFPAFEGRVQLQMDRTQINPGSLSSDPYTDLFGTVFSTGSTDTSLQKKSNNTFAIAYDNELFHVDIGTAPKISNNSFKNNDIVFGGTYYIDYGNWSFKPSVYRRAKDNSVLSYFGQRDTNTKIVYGAVKKTGLSLGSSYFINDDSGIWLSSSLENLKGKHVENNYDLTLMGGYYHHIVNYKNERLTLAPSSMFMHYDKDLSEYTYSQGGYYSPQAYLSANLALRYLRRNEYTSYLVELSGSISYAKTKGADRYPFKPSIDIEDKYAKSSSDSSVSYGGGIIASIEQRISGNLVIGAYLSAVNSEDYSPITSLIYFKWFYDKWNGDLNMPPQGPSPITTW